MDSNTESLLRELATKLGTTTEKLYTVLVKQAKVNIINSFVSIGINAIAILVLYLLLGNVTWKTPTVHDSDYQTVWANENYVFVAVWMANAICWFISIFNLHGNIEIIVSNSINPEYEAIMEILDTIKQKD